MKLRKFFGQTSRSVLEQVRAELGDDALILENRSTAEGIEITAVASDTVDNILAPAAPVPVIAPAPAPVAAAPAAPEPQATVHALRPAVARIDVTDETPAALRPRRRLAPSPEVVPPPPPAPPAAPAEIIRLTPGPVPTELTSELAALRELVEQQLAQFAWSDAQRRSPLRAQTTRDLLRAGFGAEYSREITQRMPEHANPRDAHGWLTTEITAGIRCATAEDDIVTRGGVYALTGATGVGKTTTAAKIAARCAVRRGAASLALITTDSYRVGAHDQLRIYARILGIGVHTVNGPDDLRQALDSLAGKHLVLIDTVGMGQRDARVKEHAMLLAQPEVQRLVVLAATAQADTNDEVVDAYRPAADGTDRQFAGCIVTKLDEAARLGEVLDVVIRRRLLVHYLSTGQRVPEDLYVPNVAYLVSRALRAGAKQPKSALQDDDVGLVLAAAGARHG
ncbi:MAG: flagellar biosynthesis protein FlhF [Burkholderiales bacterium]